MKPRYLLLTIALGVALAALLYQSKTSLVAAVEAAERTQAELRIALEAAAREHDVLNGRVAALKNELEQERSGKTSALAALRAEIAQVAASEREQTPSLLRP